MEKIIMKTHGKEITAEGRNEECKRLYIEMVRYAEGLVSQAA